TLRGKKKLSMQAMLVFAAMNLKKLANWTWKGPNRQPSDRNNRIKWTKTGRIFKIRPVLSTVCSKGHVCPLLFIMQAYILAFPFLYTRLSASDFLRRPLDHRP
ncbi:hypothetical protein P8800_07805, partial [Bacillus licheniformis]